MDFSGLTDEQLLVHIHAMLPDDLQKRLTELQARNNEGELQPDEVEAFDRLLRIVHTGTLLKSHALLAWERRYGALPQGFGRASAS
jgi:hypothetical protein